MHLARQFIGHTLGFSGELIFISIIDKVVDLCIKAYLLALLSSLCLLPLHLRIILALMIRLNATFGVFGFYLWIVLLRRKTLKIILTTDVLSSDGDLKCLVLLQVLDRLNWIQPTREDHIKLFLARRIPC